MVFIKVTASKIITLYNVYVMCYIIFKLRHKAGFALYYVWKSDIHIFIKR